MICSLKIDKKERCILTKTLKIGEIPKEVAGYRIIEEIGEGGMARVFRGKNNIEGEAAIKLIHSTYKDDKEFRERFLIEARALTKVVHEGVVRILQLVDDSDTLAIVMEFLEGQPLNKHLDPSPEDHHIEPLRNPYVQKR